MRELAILEHLSYVVRASAEEASSEAKSELSRLFDLVAAAPSLDAEVRRVSLGVPRKRERSARQGAIPGKGEGTCFTPQSSQAAPKRSRIATRPQELAHLLAATGGVTAEGGRC